MIKLNEVVKVNHKRYSEMVIKVDEFTLGRYGIRRYNVWGHDVKRKCWETVPHVFMCGGRYLTTLKGAREWVKRFMV